MLTMELQVAIEILYRQGKGVREHGEIDTRHTFTPLIGRRDRRAIPAAKVALLGPRI